MYLPAKFLAPLNFNRLFLRAQAYKNDQGISAEELERLLGIWYRQMEKENLLRSANDPRYNPLLDAMIRDSFSPWHVITKHNMTLPQIEFMLRELERSIAKACIADGEAVGPIASQAMGEPATQSTLNLFHFAGSQNTQQSVISRLNDTSNACKKPNTAGMTAFVHPQWSARRDLVEMIARDIKERRLIEFVLDTEMHLPNEPWPTEDVEWFNKSLEMQMPKVQQLFTTLPCVRIEFNVNLCRKLHLHLMEIATCIQTFFKRGVAVITSGSYSDRWVVYVALDHDHVARLSTTTNPAHAAASLLQSRTHQQYNNMFGNNMFGNNTNSGGSQGVYGHPMNVTLNQTSARRRSNTGSNNNNNHSASSNSTQNATTSMQSSALVTAENRMVVMTSLSESAVIACLQESCIRGIARVTDAMVVSLETRYLDPTTNTIQTRSCCPNATWHTPDCSSKNAKNAKNSSGGTTTPSCGAEWVIVTQGSNFEALLNLPAIHFERCSTTYVHDVHKLLGIEGARRWLDENLEDLVRRSRVDVHHTKLIADVMTRTGYITPMTRNGLQNSTDSACRLLFEDVLENIKKAGVYAQSDPVKGVPESILMGIPAKIGTGKRKVIEAPKPPIQLSSSSSSSSSSSAPSKFRVAWGTRKVPCGPRPFRFFQQLVPVLRNGQFAPTESHTILTTPSISSITTTTTTTTTSMTPITPMAPVLSRTLFNYDRVARWSEASATRHAENNKQLESLKNYGKFTELGQPVLRIFNAAVDHLWNNWLYHQHQNHTQPHEFQITTLSSTRTIYLQPLHPINNSELLVHFHF
jgi:hypothetical protein